LAKSTPIVGTKLGGTTPLVAILKRCDFPTPYVTNIVISNHELIHARHATRCNDTLARGCVGDQWGGVVPESPTRMTLKGVVGAAGKSATR
jgi:hypothetical protein